MVRVFLSAGHGGSDPGACANGLRESDGNLQTMLACRDVLMAHGIDVVCSRTTDENDPVEEEVREANASGADLAVSFHENAGGGDGYEAYYYGGDANGERLARIAERRIRAIGQNSRGVKDGSHLWFVRATNMTAVLFESFFVDSEDSAIGDTEVEQRAFGEAYARAILEYFGIGSVTGGTAPSKPTSPNSMGKVTITYALMRDNGAWWPNVSDFNNANGDGYAGAPYAKHKGFWAIVDKGSIRYKVHKVGGGWTREYRDGESCIIDGIIDGIACYYATPDGYSYQQVYYRSQTTKRSGYLGVCCDYGMGSYDGWAGMYGEPLDRFQAAIRPGNPF